MPNVLNRLNPELLERFRQLQNKHVDVWGINFVTPNEKHLDIPFRADFDKENDTAVGYVSKRIVFDNFLADEVRRCDDIDFRENVDIKTYDKTDHGFRLTSKDGETVVECKLLLDATGANSQFARHHAGLTKDNAHHAGAVRAYYKNVGGMNEDNFIELQFLKGLVPGYFWIFPLPNNEMNVGLGIRSDYIKKRRINLKKLMVELTETHPRLKERFKNAELISKITGFPLPLGSKERVISGDNFLLVGDSGHLVDPLTGEGIGNALYAGYIAAELAEKALADNDFSADYLKAYDVRVARVLGQEMKLSYRMQQMLRYEWIGNLIGNVVGGNGRVIEALSSMYYDLDKRKQVVNPMFWVRQLFGKRS